MKPEEYSISENPLLIRYEDGEPVEETMLAILLVNDEIVINNFWWKKDWPKEAQEKATSLAVICNDVFAWGASDCQSMTVFDIPSVFEYWEKDPTWGTAVWCIKKRNMLPQKPVYEAIQNAGIWDLDVLGLPPNPGESATSAKTKIEG